MVPLMAELLTSRVLPGNSSWGQHTILGLDVYISGIYGGPGLVALPLAVALVTEGLV